MEGAMGHFSHDIQDAKFLSPIFHAVVSFEPFRKWCASNHKLWDSDKCAAAYVLGHEPTYFDYIGEGRNATNK
jgi:hypothetical protein